MSTADHKEILLQNADNNTPIGTSNPLPVTITGGIRPIQAATVTTTGKKSVAATSTIVLASNSSRKSAIIVNDSDEVIYLNYSATAIINEGIRLNASGGVIREELYTGVITAICASGSKNLTVTEI